MNERVENLLVIGYEERESGRRSCRKKKRSVLFRHDDMPNKELYCVNHRYVHCYRDGGEQFHFNLGSETGNGTSVDNAVENDTTENRAAEEQETPANTAVNLLTTTAANAGGDLSDDVQRIRAMGYEVDDDNDPAPENVPHHNDDAQGPPANDRRAVHPTGLIADHNQEWGHHAIDQRRVNVRHNVKPSVPGIPTQMPITNEIPKSFIFLLFFGRSIFDSLIIPSTNASLREDNLKQTTMGEFLRWIGIWFFLSTTSGYRRRDYWSNVPPNLEDSLPPYRFHHWMTKQRFDSILRHLSFIHKSQRPRFIDKFWKIRELVKQFNANMATVFSPGWMTCLDESMSIWTNMWTCPGWMVVPRKPHPFGNEWHTICCGICGILFHVEVVEGKDRPPQLPKLNENKFGNTVNLLLRMCSSIYGSGRIVILDSGFCVLKGIIELAKRGVYAGAQIKKRRYWPKYVPGDVIAEHFATASVGESNAVKGEMEGIPYNIFTLNESDYTSKIMATYGSLEIDPTQKLTSRMETLPDGSKKKHEFRYSETFQNHMTYRHQIDDHNNLRHQQPSLEETWKTQTWENRVFGFLLAVSEVNAFKYFVHFVWKGKEKMTLHKFRKELALALIYNEEVIEELGEGESQAKKKKKRIFEAREHVLMTAPVRACEYAHGTWKKHPRLDYPNLTCKSTNCKNRVRTYCSCHPGHWLCTGCWGNHRESVGRAEGNMR